MKQNGRFSGDRGRDRVGGKNQDETGGPQGKERNNLPSRGKNRDSPSAPYLRRERAIRGDRGAEKGSGTEAW